MCSEFWKKYVTGVKPEKIAVASIAMLDCPAAGTAAGIGAWHEPRQVQTWWSAAGEPWSACDACSCMAA